jgi:hypothetical protein
MTVAKDSTEMREMRPARIQGIRFDRSVAVRLQITIAKMTEGYGFPGLGWN